MTEGGSQGLFVVVAVIIFGIFVSIAYLLFDDTLKPALAGIFKDGIFQAEKRLEGSGVEYVPGGVDDALKVDLNGEDNVKENNGYIYLRLRDNTVETSGQEIWAKTKVKTNDSNGMQYIAIQQISTSFNKNKIGFVLGGSRTMKGNLTIPDTVTFSNGAVLPILEIENQAFENATFDGEFTANGVRKIGNRAFYASSFKAYSAKNLEDVGNSAFYNSSFNNNGEYSNFNSSKIKNIGEYAYRSAYFTGDFIANELINVGGRSILLFQV